MGSEMCIRDSQYFNKTLNISRMRGNISKTKTLFCFCSKGPPNKLHLFFYFMRNPKLNGYKAKISSSRIKRSLIRRLCFNFGNSEKKNSSVMSQKPQQLHGRNLHIQAPIVNANASKRIFLSPSTRRRSSFTWRFHLSTRKRS